MDEDLFLHRYRRHHLLSYCDFRIGPFRTLVLEKKLLMKVYPLTQIIIIAIAVISLSLLYFFYPATGTSFHPKCLFHEWTGLYCPGCGSQRAVSALLHGDILKAIDLNILMVASLPFIFYSA